jgi:predicted lipid carrier protein YhbT
VESPDPAQIAGLIGAVDDTTLEDQIVELGVDTVLGGVFEEMARRFLPHQAVDRVAVIQYDLRLRDGSARCWQVSIAQGGCSAASGTGAAPQVTVQIALPKFMRLLTGTLDPMMAFMSGELKVRGDVMLAQQMQAWFDRSLQPPAG